MGEPAMPPSRRCAGTKPVEPSSRRFLAGGLAPLGRLDEALSAVELFRVANPDFSTRHWAEIEPFQDDAMREYFVEGFPRAGLPG
jgi:hypothetical protein